MNQSGGLLWVRIAFSLLCSVAMLLLMWMPVSDPLPEIEFWYEDKWQHLLAYFLLTMIWYWAISRRWNRGVTVAIAVTCYSVFLESGQLFIPYRGFELLDLLANFLGCMLAWAVALRFSRRENFA